MWHSDILVLSGIPAGTSGTGRLVAHLKKELRKTQTNVRLISKPERPPLWLLALFLRQRKYGPIVLQVVNYALDYISFWLGIVYAQLNRKSVMVLLHPQNLGYKLALRLLENRRHPSLLYLLDSSFFCIASYNYVRGENEPCLRCLGGHFEQIQRNNCVPFPRPDWAAMRYVERLRLLVREGRVRIAAQNLRQAELASRHFVSVQAPKVVGLWTNDWDDILTLIDHDFNEVQGAASVWDVVFHGHCLEPKGALWLAEVATHCRDLIFLFPFAQPASFKAPPNCHFQNMSWENGLREAVVSAWCTIVPSLWSAPIEGALVKSLAVTQRVAVVVNQSSFSDEIPEDLVLRLPCDPVEAANVLCDARKTQWHPNSDAKLDWLLRFRAHRERFVGQLVETALDCIR